jgi:hypothetical protein
MKIDKLQPGMIVYDVHKYRMGNTMISTVGVWPVQIIDVDKGKSIVTASWNGNPPKRFYRIEWSKWRLNKPVLIDGPFGSRRLAKRGDGL